MKSTLALASQATAVRSPLGVEARDSVMIPLTHAVRERTPGGMGPHLEEIRAFLDGDMREIESDLAAFETRRRATPLHDSALHLLGLGGKRIRPMCVAIAARVGTGFDARAQDLAVAAELVHSATLLHDDVVDTGDKRRGAPTARVLYGNAASIYAGDWLLVEALMRVRRSGTPELLDRALGVLAEMLEAEALQLSRRGNLSSEFEDYMRVAEGKTASLFRWAMYAGARTGGLAEEQCAALERFGGALGIAFQLVDDALDVDGEVDVAGKSLLQDVREGKVTLPLMVALERDPALRVRIENSLAGAEGTLDDAGVAEICASIRRAGGHEEARALAHRLIADALAPLEALPDSRERGALFAVAHAVVNRRV